MASNRKRARLEGQDNDAKSPEKELRHVDSHLLSVVGNLAQNGCIGATELGRIGTTCSSLREASHDEASWASLCRHRWANTDKVPQSVINARCYRWLYKRRTGGIPKDAEDYEATGDNDDASDNGIALPLPRARSTHENLMLLVDISVEGVPYVSEAIAGDALRPLLEKGSVPLATDRPIPLRTSTLGDNGDFGLYDREEVHAVAHVLDLNMNKCACLVDSWTSKRSWIHTSPSYVFLTESGRKKELSQFTFGVPVDSSDTPFCRTDNTTFGVPETPAVRAVPLDSATRSLANRAIPSIFSGFKGVLFRVNASQVMTKSLEKHLGFSHLFSKIKESEMIDANTRIDRGFLMRFEDSYWKSYFKDNSYDPLLTNFVKEADSMKERFGGGTALLNKFELQAYWLDRESMFCDFCNPQYTPTDRNFSGVTLHHIIDGLRGWNTE